MMATMPMISPVFFFKCREFKESVVFSLCFLSLENTLKVSQGELIRTKNWSVPAISWFGETAKCCPPFFEITFLEGAYDESSRFLLVVSSLFHLFLKLPDP